MPELDGSIVKLFCALPLDAQEATLKHLANVHDLEQSRKHTPYFIELVRREIAKEEKRLAKKT